MLMGVQDSAYPGGAVGNMENKQLLASEKESNQGFGNFLKKLDQHIQEYNKTSE